MISRNTADVLLQKVAMSNEEMEIVGHVKVKQVSNDQKKWVNFR